MSPATLQELELHRRLADGDETASAEAFEYYVDALAEHLSRRYPGIAAHNDALVDEAVADALFDYIACPEKYDPQQKSLSGYLRMAAEGDLLNLWRKTPRPEKAGKLTSFDEIEERELELENGALSYLDDLDIGSDLASVVGRAWQAALACVPGADCRETVRFLDDFVELGVKSGNRCIEGDDCLALRNFWRQVQVLAPDAPERAVLVLMLNGVRETAAYAEALTITHLTVAEQTDEVKRVKDKLKKRLQRADWRCLGEEACDAG